MTQTISPEPILSSARLGPPVLLGGTAVPRVQLGIGLGAAAFRRDVTRTAADQGSPLFVSRELGVNPDIRAFASVLNAPTAPASNVPIEDPLSHAQGAVGGGPSALRVLMWPPGVQASTPSATYVGRGGSVVTL